MAPDTEAASPAAIAEWTRSDNTCRLVAAGPHVPVQALGHANIPSFQSGNPLRNSP
jgi:hypothetical protein